MGRYVGNNRKSNRDWKVPTNAPKKTDLCGKKVCRGGRLHGIMKGKPMIILGNSSSLNLLDLDVVREFITLGCNRILRLFEPDFYTVVDRAPYIQDKKLIEQYRGTRVLSETLFDTQVSCRRTQPQEVPDYEWYRYRAVSSTTPNQSRKDFVYTTVHNDRRVARQTLAAVQTNLDSYMASGANIAYCMLQIAIAMGANPIGIAGVDLAWKSVANSHFFGNGKAEGAFMFNTKRVMKFFEGAAHYGRKNNVKIYNLSPEGVLSPTFERITEKKFYQLNKKHALGKSLCPRELLKFEPTKNICFGDCVPYNRRKPNPKKSISKLPPDRRPDSLSKGKAKTGAFGSRAVALERIKRKRREGAENGAGTSGQNKILRGLAPDGKEDRAET